MGSSIHELRKSDGVRQSIIVGEDGMPLYYPNLFITTLNRHKSKKYQANLLFYIDQLRVWEKVEKIDIEERFRLGEPLSELDIISLVEFCSWTTATIRKMERGVRLLPSGYEHAGRETIKLRTNAIKLYLKFLYKRLSNDPNHEDFAEFLDVTFSENKPKSRTDSGIKEIKQISEEQLKFIFEKLEPGHPDNPWKLPEAQVRNILILRILTATGTRRGEVAALYVSDVSEGKVSIYRRHNDPNDTRTNQPLVKTNERSIPVSTNVMMLFDEYVLEYRAKHKHSKKHPYLFVNVGRNAGQPITDKTIGQMFTDLKKKFPELSNLTAHVFRHNMNYTISKLIDDKYKGYSAEDKAAMDEKIRPYTLGWNANSKTQKDYNRRYVIETATDMLIERDDKLHGVKDSDSD